MTSYVRTEGNKVVYDKELTGTTEHTVVAAATRKVARTIESILITSNGTSDTLTLRVKNGATVLFPLLNNATMNPAVNPAVNPSLFDIPNYPRPLLTGHSITAQCGTGGRLWISIVMVELDAMLDAKGNR